MKYKIDKSKIKAKGSMKEFKSSFNISNQTLYSTTEFSFRFIDEKGLAEYLTDEDKAKFDNAIKERHKCDSLYLSLLEGEE